MPAYHNFNTTPAPFEFYPELLMTAGDGSVWWDFGDVTTMYQDILQTEPVTASGQKVAYVADKGPSGIYLFNSDESRQPTYIVEGGKTFLRFNAANFEYLCTGPSEELALGGCYGFTKFSTLTNEHYQRVLSLGKAGINNDTTGLGVLAINTSAATAWFNARGNAAGMDPYFSGSGASPLGLYEYSIRGANSAKVWKDAVQGVNDTSHPSPQSKSLGRAVVGVMCGSNEPSVSAALNGDLYGIMHFAAELSPGEISALRTWWAANR